LKVSCGLEIIRLQFFTEEELKELPAMIDEGLNTRANSQQAEVKSRNMPEKPEPERPAQREGVVSNPDFHPVS